MDIFILPIVSIVTSAVVSFFAARIFGKAIFRGICAALFAILILTFVTMKDGADYLAEWLVFYFVLLPSFVVFGLTGLIGLAFHEPRR